MWGFTPKSTNGGRDRVCETGQILGFQALSGEHMEEKA